MTSEEVAWVAGVLEGEACFDGNASNTNYPRIRVEMCDMDVVERLHQVLGCGKLRYPKPNPNKPQWRSTACLTIAKREDTVRVLRAIRPWMGERRGAKIDLLLAGHDPVL